MAIKMLAFHVKNKEYKKMPYVIMYLPFPVYIIYVEVKAFFHPNTRSYRQQLIQILSMEAFYESFPQLVLQTITIIYGYPTNMIQLLSILFSFLVLTKTILMIDNQDEVTSGTLERENSASDFFASVKNAIQYNFWLFPLYISSVIYKVAAFSLTVAFFRVWSLLAMAILIIEMIVLAKLTGFKDTHSWVYPVFTNFFLINIGGANIPNEEQQRETNEDVKKFNDSEIEEEKDETLKKSYKFAKRSVVLSFIHHTLILTAIVVLVLWYGESDSKTFNDKPKDDSNAINFEKDKPKDDSTTSESFLSTEVFKTQKHWQEMRPEMYPYIDQDDEICNLNFTLRAKLVGQVPSYNTILNECRQFQRQVKIYDFLLIIGGVTLVGLFNLVLSIYSARDVKIRQSFDNIPFVMTKNKEAQTEDAFCPYKEAKIKHLFDNVFSVEDNPNLTQKCSIKTSPLGSDGEKTSPAFEPYSIV